ncbi:hypothetical protein V6N12_076320 [Hibiscus sabdariffa]|uniref:Retrotransposon gag domain-containing protein n=1 Tax=Hibiscus sabdariffa TaxID=183260 RepID=A0ABR2DAB4_9ROSI
MTDNLCNQITSFRQEDDEAMHEAWEHYRDLFRRCPMHGLPEWTQVSIFYNFVNTPTRMMLNASANGTLLDKPPREGLEILEKLAQNDYQHPTTRRGSMRRGTTQLDSSDNILAQISALTNMNLESSCYVGNYNRNVTSNTYNPAWRHHPNFSWQNQNNALNPSTPNQQGYQGQPMQNQQLNQPRTEMRMQNQESALKSLENQVGQISQVLKSRPIGGFPSDTEVSKGATLEQCKAISRRSGKVLNPPTENRKGETTVANSKAASDTDIPASADKDHNIPSELEEAETTSAAPQPRRDTLEEQRSPPPFPQRLRKQK